jgi:hypothetical protein
MTWYETAADLGRAGYTYRNNILRMAEAGAGNFSTDRLFAKTTHVCLPRDRMITTAFMGRRRRKEESDMIIRQIT